MAYHLGFSGPIQITLRVLFEIRARFGVNQIKSPVPSSAEKA